MPRKGPTKKESKTTTISFLPNQFRWLMEQRIKTGKGSMAEIVRALIDRAIEKERAKNGEEDGRRSA